MALLCVRVQCCMLSGKKALMLVAFLAPMHKQTADMFSLVLMMMQILVEQSLLTAVGLEWTGMLGTEPIPAAPASHLALRNHALLVHRAEVDAAAAELTCSTTSLSGQHAQQMLNKLWVGSHTLRLNMQNSQASISAQIPCTLSTRAHP